MVAVILPSLFLPANDPSTSKSALSGPRSAMVNKLPMGRSWIDECISKLNVLKRDAEVAEPLRAIDALPILILRLAKADDTLPLPLPWRFTLPRREIMVAVFCGSNELM